MISKTSVVCAKHFYESDIQRKVQWVDKSGNVCEEVLAHPKLNSNAVPRVFPAQPKYFTTDNIKRRTDPEERRRNQCKRQETLISDFLATDLIDSFECLCKNIESKVSFNKWNYKKLLNCIYFYILNIDLEEQTSTCTEVTVLANIIISKDMNVVVNLGKNCLDENDLKWILDKGKLCRWSQLENILIHYSFFDNMIISNNFQSSINKSIEFVQNAIDSSEKYSKSTRTLQLVHDQLKAICKKRKQYSTESLLLSLDIHNQSAAAYSCLTEYLFLPSKRRLQQISSDLKISPKNSSSNEHYLVHITSSLSEREKIVNLFIDEIYIRRNLDYKSKVITGFAVNDKSELGKTVQTLMISSVFGNFKDVVKLIPVNNLSGVDLKHIVFETVDFVQSIGLKILCIITDNSRVNQNMFSQISENTFIPNPHFPNERIFLLYDVVHIFKNIRNNWINLKEPSKAFVFPDFETEVTRKASFLDIRNLFQLEIDQITKRAYKLNYKTLYPNSLEHQNVQLVDNLFHHSTVSAMQSVSEDVHIFLKIIKTWWNIVNTKNNTKGIQKRDPTCVRIVSSDCENVKFLQKFINWLDTWHADQNNYTGLTRDTYKALQRSTFVLINIIHYCFMNFKIDYILLGKFQTDNLEKRFGKYRQLSGCNYNVSFTQILESEKKIRIHNILKNGLEDIKKLKHTSYNFEKSEEFVEIPPQFLEIFQTSYLEIYKLDEPTRIYICGYVAHQIFKIKTFCEHCKALVFQSKGILSNEDYFDYLQRGGLCMATDTVKFIYFHLCAIFEYIINNHDLDKLFLDHPCHRNLLSSLVFESLQNGFYIDFEEACKCGNKSGKVYSAALTIMANIVLNNYVKMKNDVHNASKNTNKLKNDVGKGPKNRKINTITS